MPLIGYLSAQSKASAVEQTAKFNRGMHEMGFVNGQNVAIDYRWADGHYDRLPAMATELVRRPVRPHGRPGSSGCLFFRAGMAVALCLSRMLFISGSAETSGGRISLAHVGAGFRVAVGTVPSELVNFSVEISPHDGIAGTARFGLGFCCELPCGRGRTSVRRSRCYWWSGGWRGRPRSRSFGSRCCRRRRCRSRGCGTGSAIFNIGLLGYASRLKIGRASCRERVL